MIYFLFVGPLGCFQLFITVNNAVINCAKLVQNENGEDPPKICFLDVCQSKHSSATQGSELNSIKIHAKTAGALSFCFFHYPKFQKPNRWVVQIHRKRSLSARIDVKLSVNPEPTLG